LQLCPIVFNNLKRGSHNEDFSRTGEMAETCFEPDMALKGECQELDLI
jgi:hypothetical protein